MSKLVKSYRDDMRKFGAHAQNFQIGIQSSTVFAGISQLLNEAEAIATSHAEFSANVIECVRNPLKESVLSQKESHRIAFGEMKFMASDVKKEVERMERQREIQERANRDMTAAYAVFDKANKDPKAKKENTAKLKADAEKKASIALGCVDTYNAIIAETNLVKNEFYNVLLPKALDEFQANDETSRIEFIKQHLITYSDLLHARRGPLDKSVESLKMIFNLITTTDTDTFINLVKSGDSCVPPDYTFGEHGKPLLGSSHNRRASAMLGNLGNLGLASASSSITVNRLCNSDAMEKDDETIAMPLKQGKKLANERLKQIMKELPNLSVKATQYEQLAQVQEREGNMTSQDVINQQRLGIGGKVHQLLDRKAKLETYIGVTSSDTSIYASISRAESVNRAASPMNNSDGSGKKGGSCLNPAPEMDDGNGRESRATDSGGSLLNDGGGSKNSGGVREGVPKNIYIGKCRALFEFISTAGTEEVLKIQS